jgi:hypothetical protein
MNIQEKNKILSEFEENKRLIAMAEKRIAELRVDVLKLGSGKHGDFLVIVADQERESFNLKEARSEGTPGFIEKLKEFIKSTKYQTVKVDRI